MVTGFRQWDWNQKYGVQLIYALERELKASPLFDPKDTQVTGSMEKVEANAPTFSFPLSLKLKRPIKL